MTNTEAEQGAAMSNSDWFDWQAILRKAKEEAQAEGVTVNEVLSAHTLAETRMIRETEQEAREQQLSTWQRVWEAVGQLLAGVKSPARRR